MGWTGKVRLPRFWRDGCKRKAAYALADAGGRLRERAVTPSGTGRAERLDLAIELAQLRAELWTALSGEDPEERARREALASLRSQFAAFGVDVSDLSDEEIEERVAQMSRVFAQAGTSTEDALRASRALGRLGRLVE